MQLAELRPVAAWQIHYAQAGGITGHVMLVKCSNTNALTEVGCLQCSCCTRLHM